MQFTSDTGWISLSRGNTYAGPTVLGSGTLGAITARGGALQPGPSYVLNNPLIIAGSLAITGSNALTVPAGAVLSDLSSKKWTGLMVSLR